MNQDDLGDEDENNQQMSIYEVYVSSSLTLPFIIVETIQSLNHWG